jgi:hypothetical protein
MVPPEQAVQELLIKAQLAAPASLMLVILTLAAAVAAEPVI